MNLDRDLFDEISKLLAQNDDRVSKARAAAEAIRKAGAYRWTGLYDVDVLSGVVSNIAWSGPTAPEHLSFPISKGLTRRAIATRKTVNAGDVTTDADYLTALITTQSEIVVPVLDATENRVLGTIDVESEHPHAFDPAAQSVLERCAVALRELWASQPFA
jgi:L-methionine (R)-S-oxide reductase